MAKSANLEDVVKSDDQRQRFIETTRALGCDEDEKVFLKTLSKIASAKPQPEPAKE